MADGLAEEDPDSAGGAASDADSPVVTVTVRLLVPFVVTFGLYTAFHGTTSVGGGFQGGVVIASAIVAFAFAFGLAETARWIDPRATTGFAAAGVLVFAAIAVGVLAFGEPVLDLSAYPVPNAVVYGIELVELGIAATVASTVVVFFLAVREGWGG